MFMGNSNEDLARMKPQDYSIYLLMAKRQYQIPVYQRPYSWGDKQIRSLLEDITKSHSKHLANANISDLYIGNFIVSKVYDPNKEIIYDVVDGQQRLISLTLINCALYCLSQNDSSSFSIKKFSSVRLKLMSNISCSGRDRMIFRMSFFTFSSL